MCCIIIARFNIKDLDLFNRIVEYIVTTPSQNFSAESLSNYFANKDDREVSKITLYNYLEYMTKAMMINKADRYDVRGKRILNGKYKYYLTDLVKILANQGKVVKGLVVEDRDEVMGINDCVELNKAYEWMRNRINNNWMKEGVQIVDPKRTVIGKDVKIGHDVIIHPNVEILGNTEIGDFVEILPGSYLNNSKIEARAIVDSSKVVNSCIEEGSVVGPMSYVSNNKTIK